MSVAPGEEILERCRNTHLAQLHQFATLDEGSRKLQPRRRHTLTGKRRLQQQTGIVEYGATHRLVAGHARRIEEIAPAAPREAQERHRCELFQTELRITREQARTAHGDNLVIEELAN